jgi:hypothetical protein
MKSVDWTLVAAALYVILALLVLWAVFRGLWAAARAVAGSFGTKGTLLAGSARIKLLGLAGSALLFTPLINRLARAVLNLFVALTDRLPRHLLTHWRTQVDVCDPAGARCLGDTLLVLAQATGGGIASAFRASGILSIGFGYLIFMLALWAVATHALNALFTPAEGGDDLDARELLLDEDFKVARQNFLFFLILFIGAYLSLASIAAIPDLRPEKGGVPTAFSSGNLSQKLVKQQLTIGDGSGGMDNPLALAESILYPALVPVATAGARNQPAGHLVRSGPGVLSKKGAIADADSGETEAPPVASADQVQDGTSTRTTTADARPQDAQTDTALMAGRAVQATAAADSAAQRDPATGAPRSPRINPTIPPQHRTALQAQLHELRQVWGDQTAGFDSTIFTLKRENTEALLLAGAAYVDTDTTRRLRDQRAYFHRLQRWFVEVQSDLRADYDDSRVDVLRLERRLRNWSTAASGYLTGDAPDPAQFHAIRRHGLRLTAEAAVGDERTPRPRRPLPDRGEGLGPFQYVSGWLLKTDSMPLTLIVGMMGFGLLGAAASTFVREQSKREELELQRLKALAEQGLPLTPVPPATKVPRRPVQPLVLNLPSVVIRGGSAAIVVFLGIMGGLSVLTQEAEPNPYALLFTCLVGAVFSEKVWRWAEERFQLNSGNLPDASATSTTSTTTTTSTTASTASTGMGVPPKPTLPSGTELSGTGTSGTELSGTGMSGSSSGAAPGSGSGTPGPNSAADGDNEAEGNRGDP